MDDVSPELEPFGALIGTWTTEATHPDVDAVVHGTATFEWLEGGRFLVLRTRNDHELFPDAISIIGPPESGDGLVLEYFDSRGVRRTYETSFTDGVWRTRRDAEGFDQRTEATVAPEEFVGEGQLARTPGEWTGDVRTIYRRQT